MNDAPITKFQHAIRTIHDADSRFAWKERVVHVFEREVIWEGPVLAFELDGHPTASRCFAWEVDGEVTTVLAEGPVDSAQAAVHAAFMADRADEPESR